MGNWGACRLATFVVLLGAFGALTSAEDRLRPQYHFLPPANWMNDANGIYWKGHYHLFYLYNPEAPIWRLEKQWGHAVSEDLVHWKYMSSALSPAAEGPETHCCQSGCVVDHGGIPTAVYACGWPSIAHSLCLATSRDDLKTWERYSGNPIIASPPRGLDVTGFRDPFVWREGNSWYMLVGSGIKNMGGSALLYRSRDLRRWEYLHPLFLGNQSAGQMWEVPSIFRLGNRSVFLYSPVPESRFSAYFVGSYLNHRFRPDRQGKIDLGDYFYAASTFADGNGRRVLLGWIKEGRSQQLTLEAGWAGLLSLPRVISMGPDGLLRMEPPPELRGLRGEARHFGPANIGPETLNALGKVQGDSLEILAEFLPGDAKEFGIIHSLDLMKRVAQKLRGHLEWAPSTGFCAICVSISASARSGLLVFDEAQHLSIERLETLRELLDQPPHCGLLFAGTHELEAIFTRQALELEQWRSRFMPARPCPASLRRKQPLSCTLSWGWDCRSGKSKS